MLQPWVMRRALFRAWGLGILAVLVIGGCATKPALEKTGEYIDDSTITTKVKSSFVADPTVSALAISVSTADGVVSLSGIVNSQAERQRAIQLARGVSGVKEVDDRNLFVRR